MNQHKKSYRGYTYDITIPKEYAIERIDDFYTYTYNHPQFGIVTKYLFFIEKTGDIMNCLMWDGLSIEDSEEMDFFSATWDHEIEDGKIKPLNDKEKAKILLLNGGKND